MQIIGATTMSEYKQFVSEDEALSRRFRTVVVDEPSVDETRDIIFGIRERLEKNYSVSITDEAIEMAMDMSEKVYARSEAPR